MKIFSIAAALVFLISQLTRADEIAPVCPLKGPRRCYVDLRDLVTYEKSDLARTLIAAMKAHPDLLLAPGVRFLDSGAQKDEETRINSVFGVELTSGVLPVGEGVAVSIQSLFHSDSFAKDASGYVFRTARIELSKDLKTFKRVRFFSDIPIEKTNFELIVSLIDRKVIVHEPIYGLTKVFPIGVGSFDDKGGEDPKSQLEIMTPLLPLASIEQAHIAKAVYDPEYYKGMPYLAISSGSSKPLCYGIPNKDGAGHQICLNAPDGDTLRVAFHIHTFSTLRRGFFSHGCMHLRQKDLYELFTLAMNGSPEALAVKIKLKTAFQYDHPYPLSNVSYKTVVYMTDENGLIVRDKHGKPVAAKDDTEEHLTLLKSLAGNVPEQLKRVNATPQDDFDF